jgi:hypothetical protein
MQPSLRIATAFLNKEQIPCLQDGRIGKHPPNLASMTIPFPFPLQQWLKQAFLQIEQCQIFYNKNNTSVR